MWMPLTMRQISGQNLNNGYTHVGIPTISVTSDVLDFFEYEGPPIKKQQNFEKLLDRAEIPYKPIKYDDTDSDEYVKKDGKEKRDGRCLKLTISKMPSCNSTQKEQKKFDCIARIWSAPSFNLHMTQQKQ